MEQSKKNDLIVKVFFKNIENLGSYPQSRQLAESYSRIFKIKELEGDLHETLFYLMNRLKEVKNMEDLMFEFLKGLRQGDFFNNAVVIINKDLCTPEEKARRGEILNYLKQQRKEFKIEGDDIIKNQDEYDKATDAYLAFTKEIRSELMKLNTKFHNKEKESIAGHLDMLLHNTLNYDSKFLLKVMRNTFEDYEEEEQLLTFIK